MIYPIWTKIIRIPHIQWDSTTNEMIISRPFHLGGERPLTGPSFRGRKANAAELSSL